MVKTQSVRKWSFLKLEVTLLPILLWKGAGAPRGNEAKNRLLFNKPRVSCAFWHLLDTEPIRPPGPLAMALSAPNPNLRKCPPPALPTEPGGWLNQVFVLRLPGDPSGIVFRGLLNSFWRNLVLFVWFFAEISHIFGEVLTVRSYFRSLHHQPCGAKTHRQSGPSTLWSKSTQAKRSIIGVRVCAYMCTPNHPAWRRTPPRESSKLKRSLV